MVSNLGFVAMHKFYDTMLVYDEDDGVFGTQLQCR
jgi:hypothetical protein